MNLSQQLRGLIAAGNHLESTKHTVALALLTPLRVFQRAYGQDEPDDARRLVEAFNAAVTGGPVPTELADTLEVLAAAEYDRIEKLEKRAGGRHKKQVELPAVTEVEEVSAAANAITDAMLRGEVNETTARALLYSIQLQLTAAKVKRHGEQKPGQPGRPPGAGKKNTGDKRKK